MYFSHCSRGCANLHLAYTTKSIGDWFCFIPHIGVSCLIMSRLHESHKEVLL